VDQAFDALLDFDECTVVCQRYDLAANLCSWLVLLADLIPWMRCQLLHAQRNALAVLVEIENNNLDLLVERDDFAWVCNTTP